MMVRGEEGREKSQSMGNLALEGRCRASKSEESGYDSDTRRSLEVLSGRRGEEEGEGEEPHYQVPRKELVVVEQRPSKPPRGRREEEEMGKEDEEEAGKGVLGREEVRGRRVKGVMRSQSQPARGRPVLSCRRPTARTQGPPTEHLMVLRINKGPTNELGIIITGRRHQQSGIIGYHVAHLEPGGLLHRDGRLEVGDELVNVNGANMRGLTTDQAKAVMASAGQLLEL